jgi:hypothetical protein
MLRYLGLAVGAAVVISSCAPSSPSSPIVKGKLDGIPVAVPDTVKPSVFKVAYTPDTVVIDRAIQESSLIAISPDGTYTFSSAAGPLGQLAAGKVMLLEGTDVASVTGVTTRGGQLIVTTKPAQITDLVENGHIAFTTPVNFKNAIPMTDTSAGAQGSSDSVSGTPTSETTSPASASSALLLAAPQPGAGPIFSFEGQFSTRGRYRVSFQDQPDGVHYGLTVCYGVTLSVGLESTVANPRGWGAGHCLNPASGGGVGIGLALQLAASGVISLENVQVDETIANGGLTNSAISFHGAHYTFNLSYAMSEGSLSSPGVHVPVLRIPYGIEFPVGTGIPWYVKLQMAMMIDLGASSKHSVIAAYSVASASGSGGEQSSCCANSQSSTEPSTTVSGTESATNVGSISAFAESLVVAFQLPRIGLGLGWALANIVGFFDAVWATGDLIGSAVAPTGLAGLLCNSFIATVTFGFVAEVSVGVNPLKLPGIGTILPGGTIKVTTPRAYWPHPALVLFRRPKGVEPGCPSLVP